MAIASKVFAVRLSRWLCLCVGLFGLGAPAAASAGGPVIQVRLSDRQPGRVDFALIRPGPGALTLFLPARDRTNFLEGPRCASGPLADGPHQTWIWPADCDRVDWSASVPAIERTHFDASEPTSVWVARRRFWILTASLPWLRLTDIPGGTIRITADMGGRQVRRTTRLPADKTAPLYIVVGDPVRRFSKGGVTLDLFGDVPDGRRADRLQSELAETLSRWRRDLAGAGAKPLTDYRFVWFQGATGGRDTGIQASSGSDAILIQYVPDPTDPDPYDKLEAGVLLTGAHEAFHSFGAAFGGHKPAWFNESIATYFAYEGARKYLTGRPLALAAALVDAPAAHSVLNAQARLDRGDGSDYEIFYSRGTRFWEALDRVLSIAPNGSGRLAALFRQSGGFAGVRWNDPTAIAAFFDRYSGGAAGRVVQCYLVEDACPEASNSAGR